MTANQSRQYRARHPLYSVHEGMLQRCGQKRGCKSLSNFARYRDRGIRVCDEWRHFPCFEKWANANGWRRGLQLDRIDGDGDYTPENCRFVTRTENARKRITTRWVDVFGRRLCLAEAIDIFGGGIPYSAVMSRLRRGWGIERAITAPSDPRWAKNKTRADS